MRRKGRPCGGTRIDGEACGNLARRGSATCGRCGGAAGRVLTVVADAAVSDALRDAVGTSVVVEDFPEHIVLADVSTATAMLDESVPDGSSMVLRSNDHIAVVQRRGESHLLLVLDIGQCSASSRLLTSSDLEAFAAHCVEAR